MSSTISTFIVFLIFLFIALLITGTTIVFFILHDKAIKSHKEETLYKILFTILYCFTIAFAPILFAYIFGYSMFYGFSSSIFSVIFNLYFIFCIILCLTPILKLINKLWVKSEKFEKIIKFGFVSFYTFLFVDNFIFWEFFIGATISTYFKK